MATFLASHALDQHLTTVGGRLANNTVRFFTILGAKSLDDLAMFLHRNFHAAGEGKGGHAQTIEFHHKLADKIKQFIVTGSLDEQFVEFVVHTEEGLHIPFPRQLLQTGR